MNELAELASLRAEVAGNRPKDLPRAREALNAQIRAASEPGRSEPSRRRSPAGLRAWWPASLRAGSIAMPGRRLPGGLPAGLRPRAALAAGTVVALAAVIAGLIAGLPGGRAPHGRPAGGTVLTVAYVLGRAASAAATSHQPVPRPGQYILVTSMDTEMTQTVAGKWPNVTPRSWLTVGSRQAWQSADGRKDGVARDVALRNEPLPWGGRVPGVGPRVSWVTLPAACPGAGPPRGSYEFLTTLPTDPARLRAWIYAHKGGGQGADDQAWTDIGDLLRGMLVPPKLAAALFKVAATIPGATVVPHATDAAGRAGIAVARVGRESRIDTELIFDRHTYRLLGERSTLAAPVKGVGPAGTVIESTAQLKVAVVSHLPRYPGRPRSTTVPPVADPGTASPPDKASPQPTATGQPGLWITGC